MNGTSAYATTFGLLLAAAFGLPLPEEIPVALAGAAAGRAAAQSPPEHPVWWLLWLVCVAGVVVGDGVLYAAGRLGGRRLLHARWFERLVVPPHRRQRAEDQFQKYGLWLLLAARLTPGLRTPVFVLAGVLRMPLGRFLLADGLYALPGVTLLFALAFWFTDDFVGLVRQAEEHAGGWKWVALAAATAAAAYFLRPRRPARMTTVAASRKFEVAMLLLVLLFVGTALVLGALLAVGTAWVQAYFYENATEGLTWRGAAAGALVAAALTFWAAVEWTRPGAVETPLTVRISDRVAYDHFWSEVSEAGRTRETRYTAKSSGLGRVDYVDADGRPWRRGGGVVTAILVEENGSRTRFATRLGPDGQYRKDARDPGRIGELEFVDDAGRVMREPTIGVVVVPRTGAILLALAWAGVLLAVWFAGLWLLLRFEWSHALGLAALAWLATVTLVWPAIQAQVTSSRASAAASPP